MSANVPLSLTVMHGHIELFIEDIKKSKSAQFRGLKHIVNIYRFKMTVVDCTVFRIHSNL